MHIEFYSWSTQFGEFSGIFCCYINCYDWFIYILWRVLFDLHCLGAQLSPGIPIALRVIYAEDFVRGPFHLGRFSFPVAITAVVWIAFISIIFILPQVNVSIGG